MKTKPALKWIFLVLLAIVWGSSFILMKRGMEVFPAEQVAALRLFIAFLFLLPLALLNIRSVKSRQLPAIASVGIIGNGIPAFLFTAAQSGISSSLSGMLNSLTPLFTLVVGALIFGVSFRRNQILGIIIGFMGAAGLVVSGGDISFSGGLRFTLYVILATVMYAVSVNVIKRYLHDVTSVQIASLAFSSVGPLAGIYLFTTDFYSILSTVPGALKALGYISILAIVGSALSVILFNILIKITNALFASSVTYLIPVVAIMWGVFDHEIITVLQVLSIAIILLGVYLVNHQPSHEPAAIPAERG